MILVRMMLMQVLRLFQSDFMRKCFFILFVFIMSWVKFVSAQEATFLAECEIYRIKLMKNLKVTRESEAEHKKNLLEKTETVANTLNCMEGIYDGYCKVLKTFETATGALNTYREVREFEKEVEDILQLYKEYGGGVFLNTFYDADKYLNPELQQWYCRQMRKLSDDVIDLMTNIKLYRGNDVHLKFEERLDNIRSLCFQIKTIKNQMYTCICIIQSLYSINIEREREFLCRQSCFDYRNYHYGSSHLESYFEYKWNCVSEYDKRYQQLEDEISDLNVQLSERVNELTDMYEKYNDIYDESAVDALSSLQGSSVYDDNDGLENLDDKDDVVEDW